MFSRCFPLFLFNVFVQGELLNPWLCFKVSVASWRSIGYQGDFEDAVGTLDVEMCRGGV